MRTKIKVPYLALGDSYTIGEAVEPEQTWPAQLTRRLQPEGFFLEPFQVIATTGWTTEDLDQTINAAHLRPLYDLVTLQIGVNNQYQKLDLAAFRQSYEKLLRTAIALAKDRPQRVLALTIPDWGVTPFGANFKPVQVAREIDQFNQTIQRITQQYKIVLCQVTNISRLATDQPELVAADGLHPSGAMYALWVKRLIPMVLNMFKSKETD